MLTAESDSTIKSVFHIFNMFFKCSLDMNTLTRSMKSSIEAIENENIFKYTVRILFRKQLHQSFSPQDKRPGMYFYTHKKNFSLTFSKLYYFQELVTF